jgi:hypothetical protein
VKCAVRDNPKSIAYPEGCEGAVVLRAIVSQKPQLEIPDIEGRPSVLRGAAWCCVVLCGAVWCCERDRDVHECYAVLCNDIRDTPHPLPVLQVEHLVLVCVLRPML